MQDDEKFAKLLEALGPYLDRVVIVGGWAHRLFRHHPLAQPMPYLPLMTRDIDVAIPPRIHIDQGSLRERLLAGGFSEEFFGDHRPPVTHYLAGGDTGFFVEFLTPLVGSEFKRDGTRDVTTSVAGVTAQKLRHLDILLIAPWTVVVDMVGVPSKITIANPVSYIVQKLLIDDKRKPEERAKDVLYVHDTLELFARSLRELRGLWDGTVRHGLGRRLEAKVLRERERLFTSITDTLRDAALMATRRSLSPAGLRESCAAGLNRILA